LTVGDGYRHYVHIKYLSHWLGAPVLRIDRLYRDRDLRRLELADYRLHPDRHSYEVQLRAQLGHPTR
jgi:DNA-binding GntR family transcriptional regulator